jgi:CubicO group peptidase (beta-lactamase class C family)
MEAGRVAGGGGVDARGRRERSRGWRCQPLLSARGLLGWALLACSGRWPAGDETPSAERPRSERSAAPALRPATDATSTPAPTPAPPAPATSGGPAAAEPRFVDPHRTEKILAAMKGARDDFEGALRALGAPGFAWGLVIDDRLAVAHGEGQTSLQGGTKVSADTVFRLGSVTKVFTALAVLQLRDAGRLSLDAPATTWLPELSQVVYPTRDSPPITPRHLLLHVSGLPRLGNFDYSSEGHAPSEAEVLGALGRLELRDAPGVTREYSNFGYGLLGLLITRAAAQPFDAYIRDRILRPLGMTHTVWDAGEVPKALLARPHADRPERGLGVVPEWTLGASAGAGGLYSSVSDVARFVAFELWAQPASSRAESPVLRRSSLRESQSFQSVERLSMAAGGVEMPKASLRGEGLGWSVYQDCRFADVVWHNGGTEGHSSSVYLVPSLGIGVVILANRDGVDVDRPARRLLGSLRDAGALPERERPVLLAARWRAQVEAALALGQSFDAARFEKLFAPHFRESVDKLRPFLEGVYRESGRCRTGDPVDTHDTIWQGATLSCERGTPSVVEAALGSDDALIGLWVAPKERHLARVRERMEKAGSSSACRTF